MAAPSRRKEHLDINGDFGAAFGDKEPDSLVLTVADDEGFNCGRVADEGCDKGIECRFGIVGHGVHFRLLARAAGC